MRRRRIDKLPYTPIAAPRGRAVHAISLKHPTLTACDKKFHGWKICLRVVSCRRCQLAMHKDCRPRRKKRRRK